MGYLNWEIFATLPGAQNDNFEMLCRSLIRRHYAQFGNFRALANQPGVEFHLKLKAACPLGNSDRWYGWQCKWYDLPSGQNIGSARRKKIIEAIAKTKKHLPNITDWILWTRHTLTKNDQQWLSCIKSDMTIYNWSEKEIEEHLSGPGEILRSSYFGELVLTPELLSDIHRTSSSSINKRWFPQVHQTIEAERFIHRAMLDSDYLDTTKYICQRLDIEVNTLLCKYSLLESYNINNFFMFIEDSWEWISYIEQLNNLINKGDIDYLYRHLLTKPKESVQWDNFTRSLRAKRVILALRMTNIMSDIGYIHDIRLELLSYLKNQIIAVVADAGCGKTQLAAQLTSCTKNRPAGILLYGRDFFSQSRLDDLVKSISIHGKPVQTFEALIAAVDAAGTRAGKRLPIVIDGLNEAEDPRVWKTQLPALSSIISNYPHVIIIYTLRPEFINEALPEKIVTLEISGFHRDTENAINRYFLYYRIDSTDADIPLDLLRHPLTLRIFCEVTNPDRKKTVGVEGIPSSLAMLFDRYLDQTAERIMQLSPLHCRYYESDIRTALNTIGRILWEGKTRSIDVKSLREILGDSSRPWDQSIIRALEYEGLLLKTPTQQSSTYRLMFLYDMISGYIIADSLLTNMDKASFETWFNTQNTRELFIGELELRHPLAYDIFRSLVEIYPTKMFRQQLWKILDGRLRSNAIYLTAWLDPKYLDRETLEELARLVTTSSKKASNIFFRFLSTRSASSHPLNSLFLDYILKQMPMNKRDLIWTEWLRLNNEEITNDIIKIEEQILSNKDAPLKMELQARWLMWTLTSTVRPLRDHSTRALFFWGCRDQEALFNLTLYSLDIDDPYISERMLASCYGVAMSLYEDNSVPRMKSLLQIFANKLVDKMFLPNSPNSSRHILKRDYALGIIELALRINKNSIESEKLRFIKPPFRHLPSPFKKSNLITDEMIADVKNAIHMDFGNYTLGRLIPNRGNYDFKNRTYKNTRRQIEFRIKELGYDQDLFEEVDKMITHDSWRGRMSDPTKTDRYGKKYSWIAYYEMYGLRFDKKTLPQWRLQERTSDADIDPSFPESPSSWKPHLKSIFEPTTVDPRIWIADGPTPDYKNLLSPDEIDGESGPWVLLEGFIEQTASSDQRQIFTFLRGILAESRYTNNILKAFNRIEYPGNFAIPEPMEDHYTYAGEIPWSRRFASSLRNSRGKSLRDIRQAFERYGQSDKFSNIPVEIPVCTYQWESYHSTLNQETNINIIAPAICDVLGLTMNQRKWNLVDAAKNIASCTTKFKADEYSDTSNLLFIRADLLKRYLEVTKQNLIWLLWGERSFRHVSDHGISDKCQDLFVAHKHIHRFSTIWKT